MSIEYVVVLVALPFHFLGVEPLVMADEPEPDTLDVALSQAATL
jgi:hypothetical protein